MIPVDFERTFELLTDRRPFPWQRRLYERFVSDEENNIPSLCAIPTGLGKTSIIAVWLIGLAQRPERLPRRLVYVVNRRTVVDQTTTEVERLRANVERAGLAARLRELCDAEAGIPLAISTLRGQFADNREWSADPARPAVICGTVDMIGSRLLFCGYGVGFKGRPLHAGFLGQDALFVHDESHLEPAFQKLLEVVSKEQRRASDFRPLKVMQLSATARGESTRREERLSLDVDDLGDGTRAGDPEVLRRVDAAKRLSLHEIADEKRLAEHIVKKALEFSGSSATILVFSRTVETVDRIAAALGKAKQSVQTLTGTLRGHERDWLARDPIFTRFLPPASRPPAEESPQEGTVYLVCTSAGEVGVNLSADHLVCDLATMDAMAQRFGRVNRFGQRADAEVHVFHPDRFADDEYEQRRRHTLGLLRALEGSASPRALGRIEGEALQEGFAPEPVLLPATDILFDAWALTTIRGKLPGRPPVAPYLHGVQEWEPPHTFVAWREEVDRIAGDLLLALHPPEDLLEDYPLKPHELLRDRSARVHEHLGRILQRHPAARVWLVNAEGSVEPVALEALAEKSGRDRLADATVLLPPSAGGLSDGRLDGDSPTADDVADEWFTQEDPPRKRRIRAIGAAIPSDYRKIRTIDLDPDRDERAEEESEVGVFWDWYELPGAADNQGSLAARLPVLLEVHSGDVERRAESIARNVGLPENLLRCVRIAARLHDQGKRRGRWQRSIGNFDPDRVLAKAGRGMRLMELRNYRHELGSLRDAMADREVLALEELDRDLVLHLIAAHHGRARPHFPAEEIFDPEASTEEARAIATEAVLRFARCQRRFGRWGLAYLESLLRAADYAASASPARFCPPSEGLGRET